MATLPSHTRPPHLPPRRLFQSACNPPPGAPALVVLDLHGNGAVGSYTEAAKGVMIQYMLARVTGDPKTPK